MIPLGSLQAGLVADAFGALICPVAPLLTLHII
jgi:hypothetical protein